MRVSFFRDNNCDNELKTLAVNLVKKLVKSCGDRKRRISLLGYRLCCSIEVELELERRALEMVEFLEGVEA